METTLARRSIPAAHRQSTGSPRAPRRRWQWTISGHIGVAIICALTVLAVLGPELVSVDPDKQSLRGRLAPPFMFGGEWTHPLGTDQLGRDLLARIAAGARVSLTIGLVATLLAGLFGVTLGLASGYLGGRSDYVVTFLSDAQLAMPFVIVAIGTVAVLGNSTRNVVLVLVITGWVAYARVIRLQAASLRHAPFVDAARSLGARERRVIGRHILPNVAGPIIVIASQQVAAMILYEAALSYLGLGVSPGIITWGGMVADGKETLLTAWWVTAIPGAAIAVTILGMNLVGDWLQWLLARSSR